MAGTIEGGRQAARTNIEKYGENFYSLIGRAGGIKRNPQKGFGSMDIAKVKAAGKKGGTISKRTKKEQ